MADVVEVTIAEVVVVDDEGNESSVRTAEVVERAFSTTEVAQRQADELEAVEVAAALAVVHAQAAADRQAAIDHAESLGFTPAMIAQMWPSLGSAS